MKQGFRTPDMVIADKEAFFDELVDRVGRFAYGRDQSLRYAQALHTWLSERFGEDDRLRAARAALAEYGAKVGVVEAETACRDAIAAVRRDVEGPRFPWRPVPPELEARWRDPAVAMAGGRSPVCPVCSGGPLRLYARAHSQRRSAAWEWCSHCFAYEHYQAAGDAPHRLALLDALPAALLHHDPEYLERAIRLAAATADGDTPDSSPR